MSNLLALTAQIQSPANTDALAGLLTQYRVALFNAMQASSEPDLYAHSWQLTGVATEAMLRYQETGEADALTHVRDLVGSVTGYLP